jgi:hypothetical protein
MTWLPPALGGTTDDAFAAFTGSTVAGRFGCTGSLVTDGFGSVGLVRFGLPDWTGVGADGWLGFAPTVNVGSLTALCDAAAGGAPVCDERLSSPFV